VGFEIRVPEHVDKLKLTWELSIVKDHAVKYSWHSVVVHVSVQELDDIE